MVTEVHTFGFPLAREIQRVHFSVYVVRYMLGVKLGYWLTARRLRMHEKKGRCWLARLDSCTALEVTTSGYALAGRT